MEHAIERNEKPSLITAKETMKRVQRSKSWLYKRLKNGEFPEPVKVGARAISFVESEITDWIKAQIEATRGCNYEKH